jgi:hypothetical protein
VRKLARKLTPEPVKALFRPETGPKRKTLLPPDASQLYGLPAVRIGEQSRAVINADLATLQHELDLRVGRILHKRQICRFLAFSCGTMLLGANVFAITLAPHVVRAWQWCVAWGALAAFNLAWHAYFARKRSAVQADRAWVEQSYALANEVRNAIDRAIHNAQLLRSYSPSKPVPPPPGKK